MTTPKTLWIAGAVSYEYLLYPQPADTSSPLSRTYEPSELAQLVVRAGNAHLVAQLLTAAASRHAFQVFSPSLQSPATNSLRHNASSITELSYNSITNFSSSPPTYTVVKHRYIGRSPVWHSPPFDQNAAAAAASGTVIISGSGEALTTVEPALDFLHRVRPRYIIHHMTRPLATGALWDLVRDGPRTRDGVPEPDFLAVIIDADDLRAEGIALSRSLSWEATAEDFVRNLGSNGRLDTLVTCPNLICLFGQEGIIHHRGRDAAEPKLYYHPRAVESGRRSAQMIGMSSAFTAGFALGFADTKPPNNEKGIRYGISAAREMAATGFVQSSIDQSPDYPIAQVMEKLSPDRKYASVTIPSNRISSGDKWSIFDSVTGDPAEVARRIVTSGPDRALSFCPIQRFNKLLTVERSEQESLRAIVGAAQERLQAGTPQPTSIGLIGPPGAGKKFTAANVADFVADGQPMHRLTYNTRLLKAEELVAACHTIRDSTAGGTLAVVVFENFETALEPHNALLNDFLVIMRDGKFTDRGHMHSLGSPLMFFLVNHETSASVVTPRPMTPASSSAPFSPDFAPPQQSLDDSLLLDYLHGIVRVAGPNQTNGHDRLFSVRRAIMLRQLLLQKHPHLEVNGNVKVEEGVLHALLLVPSYKHGLRSLEKIISTSRLSGRTKFDVSALPPEEQIQLHVDGKVFMGYLRSPKLQAALREKLAEGLFEAYKKQRILMAKTEAERRTLETEPSMRDWDELPPELKESTRAQADDIPRKLRAVNCFMLNEDRSDPLVRVPEFTKEDLDMLSEMEHERFNAERLQRQWRMGPRNSKQRTTPFLVPWRDLSQEWRDVDMVMVKCVPSILDKAGWRIYRMKKDEEADQT